MGSRRGSGPGPPAPVSYIGAGNKEETSGGRPLCSLRGGGTGHYVSGLALDIFREGYPALWRFGFEQSESRLEGPAGCGCGGLARRFTADIERSGYDPH